MKLKRNRKRSLNGRRQWILGHYGLQLSFELPRSYCCCCCCRCRCSLRVHTCYVIKHGQQSQHNFVFAVSAALLTHTGFSISLPTGFAFTLSSSSNERPHTKGIDVTNHSVTCAIRWKTHGRALGERLRRVRVTKSNTSSTCSHPHNLHIDRLTYKETKKQCNPPQYSHETRYQ